jgi:hypothetical protein
MVCGDLISIFSHGLTDSRKTRGIISLVYYWDSIRCYSQHIKTANNESVQNEGIHYPGKLQFLCPARQFEISYVSNKEISFEIIVVDITSSDSSRKSFV